MSQGSQHWPPYVLWPDCVDGRGDTAKVTRQGREAQWLGTWAAGFSASAPWRDLEQTDGLCLVCASAGESGDRLDLRGP